MHGLPLVSGALRTGGATPEGNVAQWIVHTGFEGESLENAITHLEAHIHDFSRDRVQKFVDQYRALYSAGDEASD
ncbi:hypothetical protein AA309_22795 [Microvirga vignae]|uniref:Uncharacterized protein n=2 Tax=Microvirga vignae TaxID=1225564 RepID=A0A0H1REI5_9HYPH|nr:hypothetical protein AA309_22795 [Microvirga vignae]